ncbi:MAG TPA: DUF2089 domain-containing protein [bacterium]|nr:MAG: hypothetical protein BWY28_00545 [bacterium ADurb.Bin236]HOC93251.1 DUF2089 domain-containing protein [bacterium]HOY62834.1 DUF2089 domain-containing protein [bacterium]HPI77925.1 DUF2089 domain-containing protein [bacterium]HPN94297.1 DUF2089 domain-containing protein [bacterium]
MKRALSHCPVCNNTLMISRLSCSECNTAIEGEFGHGLFSDLTDEERRFVELFVVSRGNIKEMEKRLGVSYPTVRNRLDAIIEKLNRKLRKDDPETRRLRRLEIIESIKRGDLTPDEGAALIEEL